MTSWITLVVAINNKRSKQAEILMEINKYLHNARIKIPNQDDLFWIQKSIFFLNGAFYHKILKVK